LSAYAYQKAVSLVLAGMDRLRSSRSNHGAIAFNLPTLHVEALPDGNDRRPRPHRSISGHHWTGAGLSDVSGVIPDRIDGANGQKSVSHDCSKDAWGKPPRLQADRRAGDQPSPDRWAAGPATARTIDEELFQRREFLATSGLTARPTVDQTTT
jgi:hypothetical protein